MDRIVFLVGGTGPIFDNSPAGSWGSPGTDLDCVRNFIASGEGGSAVGTSMWDGNTEPIEENREWSAGERIRRSQDEWLWTNEHTYARQTSKLRSS